MAYKLWFSLELIAVFVICTPCFSQLPFLWWLIVCHPQQHQTCWSRLVTPLSPVPGTYAPCSNRYVPASVSDVPLRRGLLERLLSVRAPDPGAGRRPAPVQMGGARSHLNHPLRPSVVTSHAADVTQ